MRGKGVHPMVTHFPFWRGLIPFNEGLSMDIRGTHFSNQGELR